MLNKMEKGYIALMTTLIISFVLLSAVITASFESFWNLAGIWQRHSKELSFSLAESCFDQAIVRKLQNPNYEPLPEGELIKIENFSCKILSVEKDADFFIIKTESSVDKTFTRLQGIFDPENFKIISLEELSP